MFPSCNPKFRQGIWEALAAMAPLHRGRDLTMNVAQRLICAIMNGAKDLKVQ